MGREAVRMPQCSRCDATSDDRVYVAVGGSNGEVYCDECLTPEDAEMIMGFVSPQAGGPGLPDEGQTG